MNQYKDTPLTLNALRTPKKRQIDTKSKITFHDVIKSILIAFFMVGLLLLISSYHQAHPKNSLPSMAGMGQNKDLSKIYSDTPNRYLLAFFVFKFWLASQVTQNSDTTHHPKSTGVNRHIMPVLAAVYDGVTLKNKPIGEYSGRFCITESEPHHPMTFHSVVLTQNNTGVVSHG